MSILLNPNEFPVACLGHSRVDALLNLHIPCIPGGEGSASAKYIPRIATPREDMIHRHSVAKLIQDFD